MKKEMLKSWVVKMMSGIIGGFIFFVGTTVENVGNDTYDKILIVWGALALISFYQLKKHSNIFED